MEDIQHTPCFPLGKINVRKKSLRKVFIKVYLVFISMSHGRDDSFSSSTLNIPYHWFCYSKRKVGKASTISWRKRKVMLLHAITSYTCTNTQIYTKTKGEWIMHQQLIKMLWNDILFVFFVYQCLYDYMCLSKAENKDLALTRF